MWLVIKPEGTNKWQLPKGRVEKKESFKETAAREVEEETRIKVKVLRKAVYFDIIP